MIKKTIFYIIISFFILVSIEIFSIIFFSRPITFPLYRNFEKGTNSFSSLILDSNGIYRHNPLFMDSIRYFLSKDSFYNILENQDAVTNYFLYSYLGQKKEFNWDKIPSSLRIFFIDDLKEDSKKEGYQKYCNKIKKEFDSILEPDLYINVKQYTKDWINSSGFKSIEFKNYESPRNKIMLLGDSFTYGLSSMPLYNSFADLLLSDGNIIFNCGIPGTNVINYYAAAQKHIPLIQPDYVLTMYFPLNDHIYFPWDTSDSYLPGHLVGQAWIPSIVDSTYYPNEKDWNSAVINCLNSKLPLNKLNLFVSYHLLVNKLFLKKISSCFPNPNETNIGMTNLYLKKIDQLCIKNGSKHFLIIIPPYNFDSKKFVDENKNQLFKDINVYYPNNFTTDDYKSSLGDPHFNNKGHQKMKEYINKIIEESEL